MLSSGKISPRQLKRLQTLWGLFWKRILSGEHQRISFVVDVPPGQSLDRAAERAARLAWIGGQIGRQIATTKELTRAEAEKAIDALQSHVPAGTWRATRPYGTWQRHRPSREPYGMRPSRREARELGLAGRRGHRSKVLEAPDPQQLERIQNLLGALGWDQRRLEAWLHSAHGPLGGRSQIKTLADANRVVWGLKGMLTSKAEPRTIR